MAELAIDRILAALPGSVRPSGGGYSAQCPAHDDRNPSLSLRQNEGLAVVYCQRGCETEDVMAALGLTMRDLFDAPSGVDYQYTNATGQPTRVVHRGPDKKFYQKGDLKTSQLYHLPAVIEAVAAGRTIYLVEGEKDVHTIESLDHVGTTAPQGAPSFSKVDVSPLKGATVIAVVDRDEPKPDGRPTPGMVWAGQVGTKLGGVAASVRFVEARAGKDVTDHVMNGHDLAELVPIVVAVEAWDDPMPLGMSTANLPSFPVSALRGPVGKFVSALAATMQTPVDLPATVALGIVAASIGGRVRVQCPNHIEPTNLFIVPVMPPASRKSGVVQACRAPLADAEARLQEKLGGQVSDSATMYEVAMKRAESLKTTAAKTGAYEDLQEALGAARYAEEARQQVRTRPRLTVDDSTPEILIGILADQGGSIAGISAEAGIFTSLTGRYAKAPNLEPVLKAHAGDEITVDRRSRATEFVPAPALTIICSIQPFALREMVERPDFIGRGLLQRILWALPRDNAGYRQVRNVPPLPADVVDNYHKLISDLAYEMAQRDAPVVLTMSPEATEAYYTFHERSERALRVTSAIGRFPLTKEWGGKVHGAMARIAGCLHVAQRGIDNHVIGAETIADAIAIADYFTAHAVVALTEGADNDASPAKLLLAHLVDKGMDEFKIRDLRSGPKSLRTAAAVEPVAVELINTGWLRATADGGWKVHPLAAKFLEPGDTGDTGDAAGQEAYAPVAPVGDTGDASDAWPESVAPVAPVGDSDATDVQGDDLGKLAVVARVAPVARHPSFDHGELMEWSA